MPSFPAALDSVLGHLDLARQHGRPIRASRAVLEALRTARAEAPAMPEVLPAKAPVPGPVVEKVEPVETKRPAEAAGTTGKAERLAALQARTVGCQKCAHLAASRKSVVFGVGSPDAELMFVGEAPGADEDRQGEPFVGKAGQLLTKIIQTMGLSREQVYIANILKCRPDTPGQAFGNRKPTSDEMGTCLPYLEEQIDIIQPKVLVALGGTAVSGLLGGEIKITSARGRWHDFRGVPVMPTFHPSFLLRPENESRKRQTWEDMLLVKERLGLEITDRERRYFLPKAGAAGE